MISECKEPGLAGLAHEKLTEAIVLQHRDDAILVHVVAGVCQERQRRRENVEGYAVARRPGIPRRAMSIATLCARAAAIQSRYARPA
jgi:hypothetical protein